MDIRNMKRMIDVNCLSYYESYKTLMYKHIEHQKSIGGYFTIYFMPAITLLPFAIELALKSMIAEQNQTKENCPEKKDVYNHNIWRLFNLLDGKRQNELITRTINIDQVKNKLLNRGKQLNRERFKKLLKENGKRFEEVRYFHESNISGSYNVDFLEAMMFSLISDEKEYEFFLDKLINKINFEDEKKKIKEDIRKVIWFHREFSTKFDSEENVRIANVELDEELSILSEFTHYDLMCFFIDLVTFNDYSEDGILNVRKKIKRTKVQIT